ncbi:MAG TPA: serine hydrolase [Acidobacteriota bacterium]|nr:serine hydrolase [Acidobacteriota bacterium]
MRECLIPSLTFRGRHSIECQPILAQVLAALAGATMVACAGGEPNNAEIPETASWPTNGWSHSAPADEGVDGAALTALDALLAGGAYGNVDAVMVTRHGRMIADFRYEHDYVEINSGYEQAPHHYNYYNPVYHPFREGSDLHTIQSITKSVTSALIGIAIQRGEIEGTDVAALSYLSDREIDDPDGVKATITLEDVLTMRPGFEWDEGTLEYTDPANDATQLEASEDWLQFVLDKPMAAAPGQTFVYNSGNSMIMSAILKATTGLHAAEYAEQHLFGPLGITDYYWKVVPDGLTDTEGGLYLRTEDLAKIGYLFLRDGVWDGVRLLPRDWVERSARPWVSFATPDNPDSRRGYGFQWWIMNDGSGDTPMQYGGSGFGGQSLMIVPELDLVAVVNSWNIYEESYSAAAVIIDHVIPAVH